MIYDIAVIGGGPAGMMAAGRAGELGNKVVLLEKNPKLGKKLLITGGGRCNLTNAETDIRKMVAKYGHKGKALFGSFSRFGVEETLTFFHTRGLQTKVEAEGRVFPESNKAESVWKVLTAYLTSGKVTVHLNSEVTTVLTEGQTIAGLKTRAGVVQAKKYIIATGGTSKPETGSTGEGLGWLKNLGHTIIEPKSALVPIKLKDGWVKKLAGLSFPEVKITSYLENKKQSSMVGKLLFTHFGLSGPLVINMSQSLAELYKYGPVILKLDLFPGLDENQLDKRLQTIFHSFPNKKIRNNLSNIVPPKMILPLLSMLSIDPEKECNAVTKTERHNLALKLKSFILSLNGFLGTDKAIVTAGGVDLKEVDFRTFQSKLISNLYLVGDILNFDRPSGGFSLQICWTSGYLAGENSSLVKK